jgi:carbon storage regulator
MLVLARRVGETIVIDGNIHVTVVAVKGNCIRLGVSAPKDVLVDRQEVHVRRSEFLDGFSQPEQLSATASSLPATHSTKRDHSDFQHVTVQP